MNYQYVHGSIQRLVLFQSNFSLASAEIEKLKQELRFLRTYLMNVEISDGKHVAHFELQAGRLHDCHVPMPKPNSGSTSHLSRTEDAFIEANSQLYKAIDEVYLCGVSTSIADSLVSSMLEVIKDFQPQIREAYTVFLKKKSWSSWYLKSLEDPDFWKEFTGSVLENLKDLLDSKSLIGYVRKSVESLRGKLKLFRNCVDPLSGILSGHAQFAACLSYLGWVDEMDENALSRFLLGINPSTPALMGRYFGNLIYSMPTRSDNAKTEKVESFVSFLMYDSEGSMKDQFAAIRDGLAFLIRFVMDLPDPGQKQISADIREALWVHHKSQNAWTGAQKQISADIQLAVARKRVCFDLTKPFVCTTDRHQFEADIQAVAREAVCFNLQFRGNEEVIENQVNEKNLVPSRLLEKMKFIKAEIGFSELIHSRHPMVVNMEDKFTALHEGLKFLRSVFVGFKEDTSKDSKMFFSQFGKVADEVISLISLIHAKRETGEMPIEINLALVLLLEKIKLIESEVYLMKLQNRKVNWMVAMKDRIQMLRQGLAFLRTFLMDSTDIEGKTEEGKLFLTYLQAVTTESSSLIPSIFVRGFTEEMVNEMSLQVSTLVEKVKLLKAELVLEELPNHENGTIVQMKVQIKTLKEGLTFLKSFLIDPPREHKEDGKMIFERSESVVNEAASLICSVYDDLMEEVKATEIVHMLSELLGKIMYIKAEIRQLYLHVSKPFQSTHRRTDRLGFVSSLLGYLKKLLMLNAGADSIAFGKHQIEMLHGDLDFLKSFLNDIVEQHNEHEEIKALWTCVTDIAYDAENVIDLFVVREGPLWYRMLWLNVVIEEINAVKAKVMETYDMARFDRAVHNTAQISNHMPSHTSGPIMDEVMVGFSDEAGKIIGRLTRGSKEMDIVSIVGMPGLGKTTLAKKVYNDPSVTLHFHVRAWCCISQFYQKRELLLDILGDIVELTDEIRKLTDEDIAAKLYRCLKGKKYLIVMDDLWDIKAWEDVRLSFPDDSKGSRVLFTSRLHNEASLAKPDSHPHHLRLLSDDESWELLQQKLFHKDDCPKPLREVGKVIATNCKGLPLAVVVIAGLLGRTEKKLDWWKQVSQSLNSQIVADPQGQCRHVLELSYKHLPDHLKSCFLYFGAFPEHKEIPVSKLLWLWIAEEFFHTPNSKSLEDSAEECLLDLIASSLVTVAKRGSDGGVKACRIHDLLWLLCLEKAKEENFLVQLKHGDLTNALTYEQRRLCIYSEREHFTTLKPQDPCVRCLLFFASNDTNPRKSYDLSFICHSFKFIRVLDLESINMGNSFPVGLELLVLLRYLAVRGDLKSVPSSVARLWNLETLLVKGLRGEVELPHSFWNMGRLRHVHINDRVAFSSQFNELENSSLLDNVDTLSTPVLYFGERTERMMRRFPRLRKLRCIFFGESDLLKNCNKFPVLGFLSHLESLKVFYYGKACYPCEFNLPLNIKKLTLSKFCLPWSEISTVAKLPNLEVLKLLFKAFEGKIWDVRDGEFPKLKFLKLDSLDISQWNVSADYFSCLQSLVLQRCKKLEQVPSCLGEIPTLQTIEVRWCSHSAASSVRQILEEQRDFGNEELNVLIHPPEWGNTSFP